MILEAMKMEHRLQAQADGVEQAVRAETGQMVDPDEVLIVSLLFCAATRARPALPCCRAAAISSSLEAV